MNPDSFEPNRGRQARASSTKRVAMFIFIGAGVLLLLVTFAIMQSGQRVRSSEPKKLFEPAQGDAAARTVDLRGVHDRGTVDENRIRWVWRTRNPEHLSVVAARRQRLAVTEGTHRRAGRVL